MLKYKGGDSRRSPNTVYSCTHTDCSDKGIYPGIIGRYAVQLHVINMSETTSKVNLFGLIGFIGTIILIVGVFLNWVTLDLSSLIGSTSTEITGWDLYGNEDYKDLFEYSYAPLIALVCGVISLITTILPVVYKNEKITRVLGIVTLILAVVAIVIGVLFYSNISETYDLLLATYTSSVGIGFWLCMVGAIITAIGGIVDILKNKA